MCYWCKDMRFGNPEAAANSNSNLIDNTRQVYSSFTTATAIINYPIYNNWLIYYCYCCCYYNCYCLPGFLEKIIIYVLYN